MDKCPLCGTTEFDPNSSCPMCKKLAELLTQTAGEVRDGSWVLCGRSRLTGWTPPCQGWGQVRHLAGETKDGCKVYSVQFDKGHVTGKTVNGLWLFMEHEILEVRAERPY